MAYGDRYRTVQETIELFIEYARHYETEAYRTLARCDSCTLPCTDGKCSIREDAFLAFGKADAYRNAAFELAHNLRHKDV